MPGKGVENLSRAPPCKDADGTGMYAADIFDFGFRKVFEGFIGGTPKRWS